MIHLSVSFCPHIKKIASITVKLISLKDCGKSTDEQGRETKMCVAIVHVCVLYAFTCVWHRKPMHFNLVFNIGYDCCCLTPAPLLLFADDHNHHMNIILDFDRDMHKNAFSKYYQKIIMSSCDSNWLIVCLLYRFLPLYVIVLFYSLFNF